MSAAWLAFFGGVAIVAGAADLLSGASMPIPEAAGPLRAAADAFAKVGQEGRDPAAAERRRLLALGSLGAFVAGWLVFGAAGAVVAAAAAPAGASRLLRARRARYRRAVDAGAAEIATALADALSGGHSLRGAIAAAAASVNGAAGHELARVAAELELGAATDDALDGIRRRIGAPAVDLIVAGCLLQRRAGGDLAQLLRSSARAFEDEARLLGDVRAATAQARFTGMVVVLLPLGGAGLAELASPGFVGRLASSPLTGVLVLLAVAMQVGAALAIRHIARIRA